MKKRRRRNSKISRSAAPLVDDHDHYAFFDALPRELRDFLNSAPYLQSAREVRAALDNGISPQRIIEVARHNMMEVMRDEQRAIWGDGARRVDWSSCGPVSRVRHPVRR